MRIPECCRFGGIALLCTAIAVDAASSTPPIRTRLESSFPAPPLALELAEAVYAHNRSSFFPFIERLAQSHGESDLSVYSQGMQWLKDEELLSTVSLALVQLDMAAHVYAPRIVAQQQLYDSVVVPELSRVRTFDPSCAVWAQYKDRQACSAEQLQAVLDSETFYGTTYVEEAQVEPQELELDHEYEAEFSGLPKLVVLYANVFAPEFSAFHEYLTGLADSGEIRYTLRFASLTAQPPRKLTLAGYGVELALKSTEYKVIDDRDLQSNRAQPAMREQNGDSATKLFTTETEPLVKGLSEKQLPALGIQAAQMVIAADDKLTVLRELAQDLPRYAHLLSELPVNSTLADEVGDSKARIRDTFAVNGLKLSEQTLDPFHILEHLHRESAVIDGLQTAGLSQQQALKLLLQVDSDKDDVEDGASALSFDMRDHSKEQRTILWLNDLESDRRFAGLSPDINRLRHITRLGMMQPIRRNVVQAVFALDLSQAESWIILFEDIIGNIEHGMPMQFGLVPLVDRSADMSAANQMAKLTLYLRRAFKKRDWQAFMRSALIAHLRKRRESPAASSTLVETIRAAYEKHIQLHLTKEQEQPLGWDDLVGLKLPWLAARWQSTVDYCTRLDLSTQTVPTSGLAFINGVQMSLKDNYQQQLFMQLQQQTLRLADSLRDGSLHEDANIQDFVYGERSVGSRNSLVFASDDAPLRFLDLGHQRVQSWLENDIHYLSFDKQDADSSDVESDSVSVWVIGDFSVDSVRRTAADALIAAGKERAMRVALIHVAFERRTAVADRADGEEDEETGDDVDAPQVLFQLASSDHAVAEFVAALLADPTTAKDSVDEKLAQLVEPLGELADEAEQAFARNRRMLSILDALPAEADSCLVAANGRLLPPITPQAQFSADSFVLLARHELHERVKPVVHALANVTASDARPDQILTTTAIVERGKLAFGRNGIFQQRAAEARTDLSEQLSRNSSLYLRFGNMEQARFRIQCVVDPLSERAQKWVPMLQTLLAQEEFSVELWLNPPFKTEELPVRRFYRYLWPAALKFDAEGRVAEPAIEFLGVPADPLLTLGMDVPTAWLVSAVESMHDLDNIRLSSVQTADISATYQLEYILVEGHLVDTSARTPVRGLEVQLGTAAAGAMTDTIVMANLGYLQLKASPGVWQFSIREGRSADIYRIDDIGRGRWNYAAARRAQAEDQRPVLVTSFCGTTIFPLVSKRPGKEAEDVLEDAKAAAPSSASSGGLWGKFKGALGKPAEAPPHFDVFAVASGHLYERLMSIMMLSVRNTTQSSVKFWLIENFMSPSFKAFVPQMAAEFNFDYEFVTYKWPHWLHRETEKQRTIWGYKILFLDVLFPLDLERVIFVDADQIVRADLQELADMDLEGAPYGYTPFCDDRKEIDGYRFWKQGWWRDHLRGKPYHISALYVVDLRRFRQLAAGDRMRGQYQALSRDGGSLANLDQDLPNNMQHIVPIFSLPQEWLWCETWCSDEALGRAKTIDLCNNPMTKEPKLERARRLLPEWSRFDRQVAEFSRRLAQAGKLDGAQIADAEAVNIDQHNTVSEEHGGSLAEVLDKDSAKDSIGEPVKESAVHDEL
ncbi:killer toxin resistant protein [Coemansia sp. RSA 2702]|nr:killer toxin resistant protein [Coemansia sp. RSA 2702]